MASNTVTVTPEKLAEFLAGLTAKKSSADTFTLMPGKRYCRIVRVNTHSHGRSAYGFIDLTNGDVLKSESWKTPAKHARGNVFNPDLGLTCCEPYSVAYLN